MRRLLLLIVSSFLLIATSIPSALGQAAVNASMSTFSIQSAINGGTGATFAAGTYNLTASLTFPCNAGQVYSGPNVGIVSHLRNNLPTVIINGPNSNYGTYSFYANANGGTTFTTNNGGCTFQYFYFNGQHGGIQVNGNSSGVTIRQNYWTGLNGAAAPFDGSTSFAGGQISNFGVNLSGDTSNGHCSNNSTASVCGPAQGVSYILVDHNVFYNNCFNERATYYPDSLAYCTMIWTLAYSNHVTITNNYIELAEEGIKFNEVYFTLNNVQNNMVTENNRMLGISRIGFESQQHRGGTCSTSHNSAYDQGGRIGPPGYNSFNYSFPCNALDNVSASGGFTTSCGGSTGRTCSSGAQYGIAFEEGDNGSNNGQLAHYNYFLNGNYTRGATSGCAGDCYGSGITVDENQYAGGSYTLNYFSGTDGWTGTPNDATLWINNVNVNAGYTPPPPTMAPNTVVQTSVNVPTAAPVISIGGTTVSIAPGDPNHRVTIFYTLDGSTPQIFPEGGSAGTTQVYTAPFVASGTVKAIAQWGQGANQGIVFTTQSTCSGGGTTPCNLGPNGSSPYAEYGLIPSGVASATISGGGTPTLTSLTVTVSPSTLSVGGANGQATAKTNYSDGSSYDVTTGTDPYARGPATFLSSSTAVATIVAGPGAGAGVITPVAAGATNISATLGVLTASPASLAVVASGTPATLILGQNQNDVPSGVTYANAFNSVYSVTTATTIPGNCHLSLPGAVTSGKHYDCLLISAPSATTEATTAICKGTYTTTSAASPGTVTIPMSGCPSTIAAGAYWVATITDDPSGPIAMGFYDCGAANACQNTTAPTSGVGTYNGYWASVTYGSYSSLPSSFGGHNPNQPTQWIDLTATGSGTSLVSAFEDNVGSVNTFIKGTGYQQHVYCKYADNMILQCDFPNGTSTDARGSRVTAWSESSGGTVMTIGAAGGATEGLITTLNYGTSQIGCTVTGGIACSPPYTVYVIKMPTNVDSYTGVKLSGMSVH